MYLSIHYHSRLPRRVMLCTYVRTDPLYQLFIARDKETVPLALIRRKNFQVKFVSLKIVVTDFLLLPQSPSLTQFLTLFDWSSCRHWTQRRRPSTSTSIAGSPHHFDTPQPGTTFSTYIHIQAKFPPTPD
jgi:hypothetical protein